MKVLYYKWQLEEGNYYLGYHPVCDNTLKHINIFKIVDGREVSVYALINYYAGGTNMETTESWNDGMIGTVAVDYLKFGGIWELTDAEVMLHTRESAI